MNKVKILRPDDWHLHLRDGETMKAVLPATTRAYGRAMVMPNLTPPVTSVREAVEYKKRIVEAIPDKNNFTPLMTCYLTDSTSPQELVKGFIDQVFIAAKLYPAGATTNSENGVTSIKNIYSVLEKMEIHGIPLSVHGEVTNPEVDIFDREKVFIEQVLIPIRKKFPELKIVFEHLSSKEGVDYVLEKDGPTFSTITPHHMLLTRNDLFKGGLRMYNYCLPVVKKETDRKAIVKAATSGDDHFFFGSDSAPHFEKNKLKDKAAGGIFNAPNSIEYVTQIFAENNKIDQLEKFTSLNGASFYGFAPSEESLILIKKEKPIEKDLSIMQGKDNIRSFKPDVPLYWEIAGSNYNNRFEKNEIEDAR
jgi:dihydroorotase